MSFTCNEYYYENFHLFLLMMVYIYHYCSYPKIVCPFTKEILVRFMVFGCLLVIVIIC